MALKHTWTTSIKNDAGASVATDTPLILTGESETNFYVDVPATETVIVEVAVDVGNIVSGFVTADKDDVTIFTNSANGAGGQTITLTANKAFAWNSSMTFANPFTTDITAFYCTNDGTVTAKVRGGFLTNQV